MKKHTLLVAILFQVLICFSQENKSRTNLEKNMFLKEELLGFSFNNSWVGFYDLKDSTFLKPGLGLHADYNYFFNENWGMAIQAGIQMRGTGIITPDYDNSVGNPDSTGRLRHNIKSWEVPVVFYYRANKEIIKNSRMIFGLGIIPMYHRKVLRKWYSVDDGFHTPISYKENFHAIDFPIRLSAGLDVNAPGGNLFRGSLIMDLGIKNNFKNPITGSRSSRHFLLGIQLTFLF
jgi:hypothetical protein